MDSQSGSVEFTITGKTADLTLVQKTITDTLHTLGKPQKVITKEVGCSQSAVRQQNVKWKGKVWKKKVHKQQG